MPWYFEKRRTPKAVAGATRKNYGTTWWGNQWLQALSDIDDYNRLPRGKTYANKGLAHDLNIIQNRIRAKVTGSQYEPYRVEITIPAFNQDTQARLLKIVTENPLFLSQLLNQELPAAFNEACLKAGISIFPRSWKEIKGGCSCPDYAIPCKHMAAVFYLIANEIDKNPFLVFELHDFDLVKALKKTGYVAEKSTERVIPQIIDLQQPAIESEAPFIFEQSIFEALDFSKIQDCRDNLMRLLSEKPVFYPEGDFKKTLGATYKSVAAAMEMYMRMVKPNTVSQQKALQASARVSVLLDAADHGFLLSLFLDGQGDSLLEVSSLNALTQLLNGMTTAEVALCAPELRSLHLAYRLAELLARKSAYIPQIVQSASNMYAIRFVPAYLNENVKAVCAQVAPLIPPGIITYVNEQEDLTEPTPADALSAVLSLFLGYFVNIFKDISTTQTFLPRWFFTGSLTTFEQFEQRAYPKSIQLWLSRFFLAEKDIVPVFEVSVDGNNFEVQVSMDNKTAPFDPPVPLKDVFTKPKHAHFKLDALRDLSSVGAFFPPLNALIAAQGKTRLQFDSRSFVEIFFEALPIIRLFGIQVLLPKALQKLGRPATSMAMRVRGDGKIKGTGLLSFANLIDFEWQVALGDQFYTPKEFSALVQKMHGIVQLTDGYVFIDEKEIAALLNKIERAATPTGPKLLQIALAGTYQGTPVHLDESLQILIAHLLRPDAIPVPTGLQATLRPYQLRGFEWLYKNTRLGFGSLIADDMGLGKTLQVIATLQRLKEDQTLGGDQKALVVMPTTLLTNWTKELARFAPALQVHVYHGPKRSLAPLAAADVLLTTYGVIRAEIAEFQKKSWLIAVIDEAQNIKNNDADQTKAIKKLKAPVRIAMTGTPVENRMSEYFSIFEFANHGYLGTLKEFTETYAKPIELERNHLVLDQFRRATAPFILRRVKSDKSIIQDLPDKIETNQYCNLLPEQAALYQNVVTTSLKAIENTESTSIQRQGLVLKMLTALKQICNHPAHFLKKKEADPEKSGKTQLLLEILQQILNNGEKALIFTQYQEMGSLLQDLLYAQLGQAFAFLHGGVSRKDRDAMVEAFQEQHQAKILILSLKAGGTGLNLTAASNVIHYDLWWNPAVEAQATDRAFRIGQQRNVQVHRFITQGTFEEKIDLMLQRKKELANLAVSAGEKWIGELSNAELRDLVRLQK